MVLDWLKNLGEKPDHPMHSIEEAKRLLAELPGDPCKALQEVTSWLTTITGATGFRPANRIALVKLLDETGQPLERDVAEPLTSPALKHFKRIQLWKTTLEFWQSSANAYCACFDELQRDPKRLGLQQKELALLIVRTLRALGTQDKILHLRYEPASEDVSQPAHIVCRLQSPSNPNEALLRRVPIRRRVWEAMFDLYRLSETLHCDIQPVRPYAGETSPTTAKQELLRALMLQAALPEAMLPRQVELAARVAARFAASFLFASASEPGCNWQFDLAQPDPAAHGTAGAAEPMTRFFGAGVVISKLEHLIGQLTTEPDKAEDRLGEDYSPLEKIVVLRHLLSHWGEHPPLRREARQPGKAGIVVAHRFEAACELVPRIASASVAEAPRAMEAKPGTMLGLDVAADSSDIPLEQWVERDSGTWGLGAAVPRKSESWVSIGTLCTLRVGDGPWFLGVVRRLYRDSTKQQYAGIEILAKKPAFVRLRSAGGGATSAHKWDVASDSAFGNLNAIVLEESAHTARRHELLVARGDFSPSAAYEVLMADTMQQLRLEEALEQGEDFDRACFTWITSSADPV